MDIIGLIGVLFLMLLGGCFIGYTVTTNLIIKDQETEIERLRRENKKLKRDLRARRQDQRFIVSTGNAGNINEMVEERLIAQKLGIVTPFIIDDYIGFGDF